MGYSFRLAARVLLYASSYRQDGTYHTAFVTPVVDHWLEREIYNLKTRTVLNEEQDVAPWQSVRLWCDGS